MPVLKEERRKGGVSLREKAGPRSWKRGCFAGEKKGKHGRRGIGDLVPMLPQRKKGRGVRPREKKKEKGAGLSIYESPSLRGEGVSKDRTYQRHLHPRETRREDVCKLEGGGSRPSRREKRWPIQREKKRKRLFLRAARKGLVSRTFTVKRESTCLIS